MDAVAIRVTLEHMSNPDPLIRRVSAEMLGKLDLPSATAALINALQDQDAEVRCCALKGMARPAAAPALLEIAARLADPSPLVRSQAVDTLRVLAQYPHGLTVMLSPLLNDQDAGVRVRAAAALLSIGEQEQARGMLRKMALSGDEDARVLALNALSEVGDPQAIILFGKDVAEPHTSPAVRRAAASVLGACGASAIPILKAALALDNNFVQAGIASALGRIGEAALSPVLDALTEQATEPGALGALELLPAWKESVRLRKYAKSRIESSIFYETLRQAIPAAGDDQLRLLNDSLLLRARRDGIFVLRAIRLLINTEGGADRETLSTAIENLQSRNQAQHAVALEALESIREIKLVRPLFRNWEPGQEAKSTLSEHEAIALLLNEKDNWLRECANYVISSKDKPMEPLTSLSIMDRVLILRRVPLLTDLAPADLKRVAEISTELDFSDGDMICEQGEPGDELYVIVSGEVRVLVNHPGQPEKEIAHRVAGEVVGEMSIISGDIRVASVSAAGDVRILCLDRLSFESLLRERPEVSMAVMRELCNRLKQMM